MSDSSGSRRSTANLLILLGVGAALLALGLLVGFYDELPGLARAALGEGAGRTVAAAQAVGASAVRAITANETGAAAFLIGLAVAAGALLSATSASRQMLAVAGTTFAEARRGGALWLAAAAAVAVAAGAPLLDWQGGAADRLKMILSTGMAAAALAGIVLAVALSALTFGREAETRSIYAIATKPVPRWAISGGKLLGVGFFLATALALIGAGTSVAARLAMRAEAGRAEEPAVVRLNLQFRRDLFPEPEAAAATTAPQGRARAILISRGETRSYTLRVPEAERGGEWLVLRLHAVPSNPMMAASSALLECEGWSRKVGALRDRPLEVPVPAAEARDGILRVRVSPAADESGNVYPLVASPRGAVTLAVAGDGLELTLAKALALLWFQLMVVAAVTLAAAGSLSFPVAAVTGASVAIFGQLSGLAVGLLRKSVEIGGGEAAEGPLAQMLRKLAAGGLALLPDFDAASASDFLARGDFVPWSLLAAGALSILLLRGLPAALLGALAFSRREVGS